MPKILRIINRLNLGGPTFNAAYLTKYLAPEFETMLVAGMIDETEESSEFITTDMQLKPVYIPEMYREIEIFKDLKAYRRLKKIILDFKPDIVHTHAAKAGALGRLAASSAGVPVIIHTFHGHVFHSYFSDWKTNLFIRAERYLAGKSTRIISISARQQHELADIYKIAGRKKIELIELGFDLQKFSEDLPRKRKQFRSHYMVDDDEVVIVIVGRIVPVKNHQLFIHSLKSVIAGTSKKIRAFIVGDGEKREEVEHLASAEQVDFTDFNKDRRRAPLTFTSWIKDVDEVYAGADIVALTSLNEGTPVSLIEAQAAGKPIVTTDAGGILDIVKENITALIVPVNDVTAFSDALLKLVNDGELRKKMSGAASALVNIRFDYRRLVADTSTLYFTLLQEVKK